MKIRIHRLILALVLTALAVVMPCIAWYGVGWHAVDQQAQALLTSADRYAADISTRLASRLSERLGALLEAESQRPFYHYQAYFHDPQGASEGASVVPSPLVSGPGDPLIQCYFQADGETGAVTLPTAEADERLQQRAPRKGADADADRQIQRELERGLASILFAIRGESVPSPIRGGRLAQPVQNDVAKSRQQVAAEPASPQILNAPEQPRVEEMETQAWEQNVDAQELYSNLREGKKAIPSGDRKKKSERVPNQQVQIFVGPLKWRTVYLQGMPTLVALREVTTPQNRRLQGFVLSTAGLTDYFRAVDMPARLLPGRPRADTDAALELGGESWRVSVDRQVGREKARRDAVLLRRGFLRVFFAGAGIALLAGLCVVGLVWQADRLARQRAQFAASAAHELRTPLAGLRLYADLLADGLGDPSKMKQYAQSIAGEAERLGRVVANVLGFSRLERGRISVRAMPGDLAVTVREGLDRHQPALEAAGVKVVLESPKTMEGVLFDRDAVVEILQNLLDNAEKYTRAATDRVLRVTLKTQANRAVLQVMDHGPGISPEHQRRLFKAFERGRGLDTPAGLGLGLVLVKALAEAQGATVSYADNTGGGSVFTVIFHVQDPT
jgi:signal transduction histidine kinase